MNGAKIREAREAKGWSQEKLAQAVGTTQQTIDKIETGKIKRTTYLPEISRALGIDIDIPISIAGHDPEMVLRTILCANPTAEQIIAALAANGLRIVSVERPASSSMEAIDDPRGFINEVLERRGITASRLCKLCDIAPSTLNRSLKLDYPFTMSTRTLKKIKEWDQSQ